MSDTSSLEDDVKSIIISSFHFYKASLQDIVRIFWLPFLVLALLKLLSLPFLKNELVYLRFLFAQLIFTSLINGVAVLFIYAKSEGQSVSPAVLYGTALKYWPGLLAIYVVIGLLFSVGFWLLVIPGVWILTRLILSDIIYVVERPGIIPALKQGMAQTKDSFWLIFLSVLGVSISILVARLLLFSIYKALGSNFIFYIMIEMLSSFIVLIVHIILFRIYMLTRQEKPVQ